jgi:hypothetical protein
MTVNESPNVKYLWVSTTAPSRVRETLYFHLHVLDRHCICIRCQEPIPCRDRMWNDSILPEDEAHSHAKQSW